MADTLPYNLELAKKITGITDEELLKFYIDAVLEKISSILGYNVVLSEYNHIINGVDKDYIYSLGRPLKEILQITKDNNNITNQCNIISDRKIGLGMHLCHQEEVLANYKAGYETLPSSIQMFVFGQVKSMSSDLEFTNLKSYSIETISYSFMNKIDNNTDFLIQVNNLFGSSL